MQEKRAGLIKRAIRQLTTKILSRRTLLLNKTHPHLQMRPSAGCVAKMIEYGSPIFSNLALNGD